MLPWLGSHRLNALGQMLPLDVSSRRRRCSAISSAVPHVRAGTLRGLAVTSRQRAPSVPDVPTVDETVKGYEASAWFGMGVKAGTPPEIIAFLNKAINEALADPKIKAKLADLGGVPMGGTPADFGKIIESETAKWKKVVEFAGASVD